MDYVYICRSGENEELRYSIRSVIKNLPNGKIWVVGGKPDWYHGPHIPIPQMRNKYKNARNSLQAIANSEEISSTFVLMNDDFFITNKVDELKNYNGGTLIDKINRYDEVVPGSSYLAMLKQTYYALKKLKIEEPLDFELHIPMVMTKRGLKRALLHDCLWRSAYGNIYGIDSEYSTDVKVYISGMMKLNSYDYINGTSPFLSTDDESFMLFHAMLNRLFPDKSYLEL